MGLLAVYIYLQKNQPNWVNLNIFNWIPLAMIILCSIMRSSGIAPVLNVLLSELYPTDIRLFYQLNTRGVVKGGTMGASQPTEISKCVRRPLLRATSNL